ncbi:VP10 [Micromonas pusilla reovirus]|uniref:Uncharacterized protein VP10 n=1 Tax=Micromonas pusilla reovirus (isolate Netherlands/2005) TaxID=649596 RepID=VP10_MPRVN|nr:VP10 [Micromonas pusilla reovirus]Q1I0U2.1 RecName: Full=Uncharacterized protein VP10 [Micromonas pusilla reovirus (isolate Netherlands)]AAZ94050.1 VP10 [Micromonas pusilla reovirus]
MNGLSLSATKVEGNLYATLDSFLGKAPRDMPTHVLRKFEDTVEVGSTTAFFVHQTTNGITSSDNAHTAIIMLADGTTSTLGEVSGNFSTDAGDVVIASAIAVASNSPQNAPPGVASATIIPEGSVNFNSGLTSSNVTQARINSVQQVTDSLGKNHGVFCRDIHVQRDDRHLAATKVIAVSGLTTDSRTQVVLSSYVLQRISATGTSVAFESGVHKDFVYNVLLTAYESHGCLATKA